MYKIVNRTSNRRPRTGKGMVAAAWLHAFSREGSAAICFVGGKLFAESDGGGGLCHKDSEK